MFSLCESDNLLFSYGCLSMIFGIQAVLDTKCVVEHKWVKIFFPNFSTHRCQKDIGGR